ncbi:MAG: allantoate amidohydrolase [Acidimicrobiales bacterium]
MTGSHLDTQPTGGRFDGVYGVLGGLEVIERLNDLGIVTRHPIEVVVWTNEEGSRFPRSMMGSGVWAGQANLEATYALCDLDGISVGDELERLGWVGELPAAPRPLAAYLELHIEQGPILETEGVEIGVVTGVQGLRWYNVTIHGFPSHAGPTPMQVRRDPAKAIARLVADVYAAVDDAGPAARATFAMFRSEPSSPNTVPERLQCTLDLRHPDRAVLDELESRMRTIARRVADECGVTVDIDLGNDSPPVVFDADCVTAVDTAAEALALSRRSMVSGAGHDACYVAGVAPTAMIFVPCEGGLSHNEAEAITQEQAEHGASVLLGAICAIAEVVEP